MNYYSSSFFQSLNTYLPLALGLFLAALALVLSYYWNKEKSKYVAIEKEVRRYVFLGGIQKDKVLRNILLLPTESIIQLFHSLSSAIKTESSTNKKLSELVFDEEVYSRIFDDYLTQTDETKNLLQVTFKNIKNELASSFLQSLIDRNDISDKDRFQSCLTLLVINPVKSWERILNIPSIVKDIASIQEEYLTFCNDALHNYPPEKPGTIMLPECSKNYFLSLLQQDDEKCTEAGLLIVSWFPWDRIENEIVRCFGKSTTSYPIRRLCVEALYRINSNASANVLYELIQNDYSLNSSSLLQFIFKTLYEMKDTGRTYIVLCSRSDNPIIRVLAESFLHLE